MIVGLLVLIFLAILFPGMLRMLIILVFLAFTAVPIMMALDADKHGTTTTATRP